MTNKSDSSTKSKKIIVVLVILLILSLLGLLGRYLYLNHYQKQNTVTVPDNIINDIGDKTDKDTNKSDNGSDSSGNDLTSNQDSNRDEHLASQDNSKLPSDDNSEDDSNEDSNINQNTENDDNSNNDKDELEAPQIDLDQKEPSDNERFEVSNMLPGDSITKYFCVKTTHDFDVKVYFESSIVDQTKQLGDVLDIKVTDVTDGVNRAKLVTNGTFNEINKNSYPVQLKKNKDGYTVKYYKIDVSLDTSVGNPYQAAKLSADFKWYVTDEEFNALSKDKPIIPGITNPSDKGDSSDEGNGNDKNNTAQTGDIFDKSLWIIFIGSALMIILLSLKNRSKKEDE